MERVCKKFFFGFARMRRGVSTVILRIRKERNIMDQGWGFGARKFKTDFRKRMLLFDSLILRSSQRMTHIHSRL